MTISVEKVTATHHLELEEKLRRYVFRVLEDAVEVERWEGPKCVQRLRLTTEDARRRYAHLLKLGYKPW